MMELWKHECARVFSDRFTIEDDKSWFNAQLLQLVEDHLGANLRAKAESDPVFVDFMRFFIPFQSRTFPTLCSVGMLRNPLGRRARTPTWSSRKFTSR